MELAKQIGIDAGHPDLSHGRTGFLVDWVMSVASSKKDFLLMPREEHLEDVEESLDEVLSDDRIALTLVIFIHINKPICLRLVIVAV